jgi:hypothetical protein
MARNMQYFLCNAQKKVDIQVLQHKIAKNAAMQQYKDGIQPSSPNPAVEQFL